MKSKVNIEIECQESFDAEGCKIPDPVLNVKSCGRPCDKVVLKFQGVSICVYASELINAIKRASE